MCLCVKELERSKCVHPEVENYVPLCIKDCHPRMCMHARTMEKPKAFACIPNQIDTK